MLGYKFDFKAELKDKYTDFRELRQKEEDNENEIDDEIILYGSKCATMEILESMEHHLLNSIDAKDREENEVTIDTMFAIVRLHQGTIKLEIDELDVPEKKDIFKEGEEYLIESFNILNKHSIKPITVIPMLTTLHELSAFWSMKNQGKEAMKYLVLAESFYKNLKNEYSNCEPLSFSCIFDISDSEEPIGDEALEDLHTDTFYYLTQLYGLLEDYVTSAVCCYLTIKRQVELSDPGLIYWALGFWVEKTYEVVEEEDYNLRKTRLCLAAATYILEKFEHFLKGLSVKVQMNDFRQLALDALWDNFKIASAKIANNWATYGYELLLKSQDHLKEKVENNESNPASDNIDIQIEPDSKLCKEYLTDLSFETIVNEIDRVANDITDKYVTNFDEAKKVFLKTLKWHKDSQLYFTFREHSIDYINININISELYEFLIYFEKDKSRQAKMHKRRIDILEYTIKDLNCKVHEAECRQLWTKLGEVYSQILKIKLDMLESENEMPYSDELRGKINRLAKSAILNYTKFIDSLNDMQEYPDDLLVSTLHAYSQIGKLYNNFIIPDKKGQLENLRKSLQACNYVVNYCEQNPKAAYLVPEDLNSCKDFVKLLPVEINKLIEEITA